MQAVFIRRGAKLLGMALWLGLLATTGSAEVARNDAPRWHPSGWVYMDWPWAYESDSGDWHWFKTDDVQWVYGNPPADGWRKIGASGLAHGWTFFAWPHVYSLNADAWFYVNEADKPWCVNMRTGVWSVLGAHADYLVIDLSGGPGAANYPVSELASAPVGGWTDEYKTTKLVLRRIPAGSFTMGSPSDELGHRDGETQHQVSLTKDFYIGVFEVTQKQWERVMGTWPSYFRNEAYRDSRPVEQVSYYQIREDPANSAISPNWPQSARVHADSFMGKLRAKTGLATLDLPTESQWEYACRAGTTTALNSGKNLTTITGDCPNVSEVGRYYPISGYAYSGNGDASQGTAKVGSYLPNTWGLYDMHGNVWEVCLDWEGAYPAGPVTDPVGPASGTFRVYRGGSWYYNAWYCRAAYRYVSRPLVTWVVDFGFRVSRTLP